MCRTVARIPPANTANTGEATAWTQGDARWANVMRLDANAILCAGAVALPGGMPVSETDDWVKERIEAEPKALSDAEAEALLTTVYVTYSGPIHSYAFRLLGSQEDADDITQEVFIRVHDRLDQLRDPARLRPWLYRIATNLCMDMLRRRTRTRRIFGIPVSIDGGSEGEDTAPHEVAHPASAAAFDGVAERDHIVRALRRMPPKYATCLVLHSAQGMSYREIAEVMGITPGAAAVRLARARDMFGRHYEDLRGEKRS